MKTDGIESFPLHWPQGWPRTLSRKRSRFDISLGRASDDLMKEIRLLGGQRAVLSTNIPLRRDGLPYSGMAQPKDSGVAVYFTYKRKPMCFACDKWLKIEDNVWAVCKSIEALRGIDRWGASDMLDRAFTGFAALPAHSSEWWQVLGLSSKPDPTPYQYKQVKDLRNRLAMKYHPDSGESSSQDMMIKINQAWEQAEKHFSNVR